MQKIILDCDPGMDDALAIIIGLADKNIDMLGITTVAGNVELSHTTRCRCVHGIRKTVKKGFTYSN